jgi:hypothetical protein
LNRGAHGDSLEPHGRILGYEDASKNPTALAVWSVKKVKEMLEQHPALLDANATWNERGIEASSHMALVKGIKFFLNKGVALDVFAASVLGMKDRVVEFMENDPSLVHAKGAHGIPILFYPAIVGNIEIGEYMLEKGVDVNAGAGGMTALHGAATFGQPEFAKFLIERGADVNARNYEGKTPLAAAIEAGKADVAEVLRQHGATEQAV